MSKWNNYCTSWILFLLMGKNYHLMIVFLSNIYTLYIMNVFDSKIHLLFGNKG